MRKSMKKKSIRVNVPIKIGCAKISKFKRKYKVIRNNKKW